MARILLAMDGAGVATIERPRTWPTSVGAFYLSFASIENLSVSAVSFSPANNVWLLDCLLNLSMLSLYFYD